MTRILNKRYFAAAIQGAGFFTALRHTWGSYFSGVRAFVMIPSKSEKLELTVTRNMRNDTDQVSLTRKNWRTGEETQLYDGHFTGGTPTIKRLPRD